MVGLGGKEGHRRDAYNTVGSATCATLRRAKSIIDVPPVFWNDG
jgi:hypothetical protein